MMFKRGKIVFVCFGVYRMCLMVVFESIIWRERLFVMVMGEVTGVGVCLRIENGSELILVFMYFFWSNLQVIFFVSGV